MYVCVYIYIYASIFRCPSIYDMFCVYIYIYRCIYIYIEVYRSGSPKGHGSLIRTVIGLEGGSRDPLMA